MPACAAGVPLRTLADGVRVLRRGDDEEGREEHEGEDEVHGGPGGDRDEPPPGRLPPVGVGRERPFELLDDARVADRRPQLAERCERRRVVAALDRDVEPRKLGPVLLANVRRQRRRRGRPARGGSCPGSSRSPRAAASRCRTRLRFARSSRAAARSRDRTSAASSPLRGRRRSAPPRGSSRAGSGRRSLRSGPHCLLHVARTPVGLVQLVEVARRRTLGAREDAFDVRGDVEKPDAARQERCDRDLVRRVERAGIRAAALAGLACEPQERERFEIGLEELERAGRDQIERRDRRRRRAPDR